LVPTWRGRARGGEKVNSQIQCKAVLNEVSTEGVLPSKHPVSSGYSENETFNTAGGGMNICPVFSSSVVDPVNNIDDCSRPAEIFEVQQSSLTVIPDESVFRKLETKVSSSRFCFLKTTETLTD